MIKHASVLFCLLLFGWVDGSTSVADQPPAGFRPLFNGTNLDGWHGRAHFSPIELAEMSAQQRAEQVDAWTTDAKQHWSVEDGELVNDGSGAYLVTNDEFTDYELRLEYRTVPGADSGIYLKATPQVQIWDYTDPAKFKHRAELGSGGLWNNAAGSAGKDPFVLADKRLGDWNSFRIIQVGARTTVYLNDQLVVDHAIMQNFWDRQSPLFRQGPIELQTHGGEIRWRNLWIRELSADEANSVLSDYQQQAFTSIFDGSSLAGWQGATDSYEVVDGAIRCQPGHGGLLLTERPYANFIARVEFRLPPGGNNGLAIRSPGEGDAAYQAMTELQILDSPHPKYEQLDPRQYHGSAYGMVAAKRGFLRPTGEWNFQEVTVDGSQIKVELNGNVILDADLAEVSDFLDGRAHPGKDRTEGYFGFAGHNDAVEFRDVAIKELP